MMLMMGQRAERLREERIRNEESLRMRKDIRSLRRTRKREARCKGMFLGYQDKWIDRLQKEADNMETDLKVTQCRPYKLEDKQYTTRLMHWIEQNDSTKVEIAKTRAKIAELKQQYREDEFAEQRKILLARQNPVRREIQRYENVLGEIHHKKDGQELAEVVETFVRLLEENWMLFQNVQLTKERNQEMLELRIEQIDERLQHYIAGIKDMLDKLEYTPEEISRLAGIFRGVHEENAIVFLCEIEKYVNKLWGIQDYLESGPMPRQSDLQPEADSPADSPEEETADENDIF
nr:hypothetical protein BaRGS_009832 [Batillaria attramentaria]